MRSSISSSPETAYDLELAIKIKRIHRYLSGDSCRSCDWSCISAALDACHSGLVSFRTWEQFIQSASDELPEDSPWESKDTIIIWNACNGDGGEHVRIEKFIQFLRAIISLLSAAEHTLIDTNILQFQANMRRHIMTAWSKYAASNPSSRSQGSTIWGKRNGDELDCVATNWMLFPGSAPAKRVQVYKKKSSIETSGDDTLAVPFAKTSSIILNPKFRKISSSPISHEVKKHSVGKSEFDRSALPKLNGGVNENDKHIEGSEPSALFQEQQLRSNGTLDVIQGFVPHWRGHRARTFAILNIQTVSNNATQHGRIGCRREVIELNCIIINAKTNFEIDTFQSFVLPMNVGGVDSLCLSATSTPLVDILRAEDFPTVIKHFEAWLQARGILNKQGISDSNPTSFVIEETRDITVVLKPYFEAYNLSMPPYLNQWVDLNMIFKRHFRCGQCPPCSSIVQSPCRMKLLSVAEMLQILNCMASPSIVEFHSRSENSFTEAEREIEHRIYGLQKPDFYKPEDHLFTTMAGRTQEEKTFQSGFLYIFNNHIDHVHHASHMKRSGGVTSFMSAASSENAVQFNVVEVKGSKKVKEKLAGIDVGQQDDFWQWQHRFFICDTKELCYQLPNTSIDHRLLRCQNILLIESTTSRCQEFAFKVQFMNEASDSSEIFLAAETEQERRKWVESLNLSLRASKALDQKEDFFREMVHAGCSEDIAEAVESYAISEIDSMRSLLEKLGVDKEIAARCTPTLRHQIGYMACNEATGGLKSCRDAALLVRMLLYKEVALDVTDNQFWRGSKIYEQDLLHQIARKTLKHSSPPSPPSSIERKTDPIGNDIRARSSRILITK